MNATTNEAMISGFVRVDEVSAATDYVRIAQYSWLSELPGLVFGLLALAYIVSSLIALA